VNDAVGKYPFYLIKARATGSDTLTIELTDNHKPSPLTTVYKVDVLVTATLKDEQAALGEDQQEQGGATNDKEKTVSGGRRTRKRKQPI
jgi:hypothetical protein